MKAHRIFTKGQHVYCLLSSPNRPNVLLPVKGLIVDTAWDPVNPLYKIKIIKMYDNIKFLKSYFFDMNFRYEFDNRAKKMPLKKEDFTSLVMRVDIVQTWLNGISNLRNDLPCRKCGECQ